MTASLGTKHSSYQVGEHVWVKASQSRCTTKFSRVEVTKIISPQSILVDRIPCHVKDLCPHHCVITPEENSDSTTSSERRAESLLQDDGEDSEPDSAPTEEAEAGPLFLPLRRRNRQKRPLPDCYFCDLEVKGECGERNHACGSSKRARICLACKMRSGR